MIKRGSFKFSNFGSLKIEVGLKTMKKRPLKFRPLEPWQLKVLADMKRKENPKKQ